jgi:hypothetical protein
MKSIFTFLITTIFVLITASTSFAQLTSPPLTQSPVTEYEIVDSVCKTYVEWTGMHIDKIDLSILENRPYRVLKPDSMATMDYNPDRLNIMTTQDGIILTQECG